MRPKALNSDREVRILAYGHPCPKSLIKKFTAEAAFDNKAFELILLYYVDGRVTEIQVVFSVVQWAGF